MIGPAPPESDESLNVRFTEAATITRPFAGRLDSFVVFRSAR
jgi:hypothetical protein